MQLLFKKCLSFFKKASNTPRNAIHGCQASHDNTTSMSSNTLIATQQW